MTFSKNLEKLDNIEMSVVYKKVWILCFEDGNNCGDFKFVRENAF